MDFIITFVVIFFTIVLIILWRDDEKARAQAWADEAHKKMFNVEKITNNITGEVEYIVRKNNGFVMDTFTNMDKAIELAKHLEEKKGEVSVEILNF